jgi:hypothetical protein
MLIYTLYTNNGYICLPLQIMRGCIASQPGVAFSGKYYYLAMTFYQRDSLGALHTLNQTKVFCIEINI